MPKKKSAQRKPAREMTTHEVAASVFHPKVLKHAKRHLKRLEQGAGKPKRKS